MADLDEVKIDDITYKKAALSPEMWGKVMEVGEKRGVVAPPPPEPGTMADAFSKPWYQIPGEIIKNTMPSKEQVIRQAMKPQTDLLKAAQEEQAINANPPENEMPSTQPQLASTGMTDASSASQQQYQVVPPKMAEVESQTQTKSSSLSPEGKAQLKNVEKAIGLEQNAIRQKAQVEATGQEKIATEIAAQNMQNEQKMAEMQRVQQERQKRIDDQRVQYEKAIDDASNTKIQDFWDDKSSATKFGAAISVALGSLGQAFAGGQNNALSIVQGAIQTDLAKQKENLANKQNSASNKKSAYAALREQLGDEQLADTAFYNAGINQAQARLEAMKQSTNSEVIKKNADLAIAELGRKKEQLNLEAQGKIETVATSQSKLQPGNIIAPDGTPVFSNASIKDTKDFQELLQTNQNVNKYKEARDAASAFRENIKAGNTGGAVVSYVAQGLKQGSFGPEVLKMLKNENLIDKTGNFVASNWRGDYSPKLLEGIQKGLDAGKNRALAGAKEDIVQLSQVGRQYGYSPSRILGESTGPSEGAQKAMNAGFKKGGK